MTKIAYLSRTPLSDVNLSYLHSAQMTMDITYYLEVAPRYLKGVAINLSDCYPKSGVYPAEIYPTLGKFRGYIDTGKFRIVNTSGKW